MRAHLLLRASLALAAALGCGDCTLFMPYDTGSSFHNAARDGDIQQLARMLDRKPNLIESRARKNQRGYTALQVAVQFGRAEAVALLLDRGANIEAPLPYDGAPPLGMAAGFGQHAIVALLLDRSATIDGADRSGLTPLMRALRCTMRSYPSVRPDCRKAAELLVARGSLARVSYDSLRAALQQHDFGIAQQLVDLGADVNASSDFYGRSPLHDAACDGDLETIAWLLERGADPRRRTDHPGRDNALDLAVLCQQVAAVRLLLAAGLSPDEPSGSGERPLNTAAASGPVELVKVLIAAGASPNAAQADGQSPLHAAFQNGQQTLAIVRLLLDAGADVNAKDKNGDTPLRAAERARVPLEVVALLGERGAR